MPRTVSIDIEQFKQRAVEFPQRCVYCGKQAVGTAPVHVEHEQYEGDMAIPYCRKHLNELHRSRNLLLTAGVAAMLVVSAALVWLVIGLLDPLSRFHVERGGGLILLGALLLGPFVIFGAGAIAALVTRQVCCRTQPMIARMPIVRTLCCVLGSTICCERPGVDIEPEPFALTQRIESLNFTFDDEQIANEFAALNRVPQ